MKTNHAIFDITRPGQYDAVKTGLSWLDATLQAMALEFQGMGRFDVDQDGSTRATYKARLDAPSCNVWD